MTTVEPKVLQSKPTDRSAYYRLIIGLVIVLLVLVYGRLALLTGRMIDKDYSHLWIAGRMIVEGHGKELYHPELQEQLFREHHAGQAPPRWELPRYQQIGCFNYPPPMAYYYALLAWLPRSTAAVANALLNLLLAGLLIRVVKSNLFPTVWQGWVAIAVLAYYPFFANYALGQNAVLFTLLIACFWALAIRGRDGWAGLMLGLLVLKPTWLAAMIWIPIIRGRWRMVAAMIGSGLFFMFWPVVLIGWQPFADYAHVFRTVLNMHDMTGYALDIQYNGLSLFRKWFAQASWCNALGWGVAVLIGLLTWWRSAGYWRIMTQRTLKHTPLNEFARAEVHGSLNLTHPEPFVWMMGISMLTVLWVSPHLNHYDLLPLVLPILVLASQRPVTQSALVLIGLTYLAMPIDQYWPYQQLLPLPTLLLLMLWGVFWWNQPRYSFSNAAPTT
ncbi:MAG: hypothetical protein HJJLKODD_00256 [Phycisphaerae bacterium]|nr:hypothetical protein [Phycisphaerae bacterium]